MPIGMLIALVVLMVGMMWFQSRSMKKRQNEVRSFHESLEAGTEVITIGGIIGKVVSVDQQYEEIVLDSEGTLIRVAFRAVNTAYTRPAFISDEEAAAEENTELNETIEETHAEPADTEMSQQADSTVEASHPADAPVEDK